MLSARSSQNSGKLSGVGYRAIRDDFCFIKRSWDHCFNWRLCWYCPTLTAFGAAPQVFQLFQLPCSPHARRSHGPSHPARWGFEGIARNFPMNVNDVDLNLYDVDLNVFDLDTEQQVYKSIRAKANRQPPNYKKHECEQAYFWGLDYVFPMFSLYHHYLFQGLGIGITGLKTNLRTRCIEKLFSRTLSINKASSSLDMVLISFDFLSLLSGKMIMSSLSLCHMAQGQICNVFVF